jgi:cysteinyl-tRNA synthetase
MDFKIQNTLGRELQDFKPITPGEISLYVCGVTVYDYCHLGHARAFINFDVVVRFLRFLGWKVRYVRNITDVDDKIINRAMESGKRPDEVTAQFTQAMHEDFDRLGMLRPDEEPRATENMDQILSMIQELLDKDFAYRAENDDIYFKVSAVDDYGKLSGRNPEELLAGARVEVEKAKQDPRDFALWKAVKDGSTSWESPWGPGRPGWHIECSAMSKHCLGDNFDIHGGGPDLVFPHHENEIAQSEAANGCRFANYWIHAGTLRVDGDKMSKSLGNFFTIRDVLKTYSPEVVRYLIIASQYRSAINYSERSLQEARHSLERFYQALRPFAKVAPMGGEALMGHADTQVFIRAMCSDFNTPEAISELFRLLSQINTAAKAGNIEEAQEKAALLKGMGGILGLFRQDPDHFLQAGIDSGLDTVKIEKLIAERQAAKQAGNYQRADEIRQELTRKGVQLEDSREGTRWRKT